MSVQIDIFLFLEFPTRWIIPQPGTSACCCDICRREVPCQGNFQPYSFQSWLLQVNAYVLVVCHIAKCSWPKLRLMYHILSHWASEICQCRVWSCKISHCAQIMVDFKWLWNWRDFVCF